MIKCAQQEKRAMNDGLRALRKKHQMSQQQFGDAVLKDKHRGETYAQKMVSRWETGEAVMSYEHRVLAADIFGMTVQEFSVIIDGTHIPEDPPTEKRNMLAKFFRKMLDNVSEEDIDLFLENKILQEKLTKSIPELCATLRNAIKEPI